MNWQAYVFSALAALIALTVHEFSHGYVAYRLGDPTAKDCGRLSLNPMRHIDLIGAACLIFFRFGWARPVPIVPQNFKKPKRDLALTALAGPVSNFLLSLLSLFCMLLCYTVFSGITFTGAMSLSIAQNLINFFYAFHLVNLGFGLFNLLPIVPLDGSRLLSAVLPDKVRYAVMPYGRFLFFGLVIWVIFGGAASALLMAIPGASSVPALSVIANILSFSDLFGNLITLVSDGMTRLFSLLPFLKTDILI